MDFDRKDFALLEALQADASQRLEDLAKLIHLAPSSVHDRVRRLERAGVIRNWTIHIDAPSVGLGVLALIGISASKPCSTLIEELRTIPSIEECHAVAGPLSFILKARLRDTAGLLALCERLRHIPGIENTETTIVLETQIERPIPLKTLAAAGRA
jgi:DNA-binding Lrp family transcriptional regulator